MNTIKMQVGEQLHVGHDDGAFLVELEGAAVKMSCNMEPCPTMALIKAVQTGKSTLSVRPASAPHEKPVVHTFEVSSDG